MFTSHRVASSSNPLALKRPLPARHTMRRAGRHLRAALIAVGMAAMASMTSRRRRRADRQALAEMSDLELRDLGLGRGEIDHWCSPSLETDQAVDATIARAKASVPRKHDAG